MENRKERILAVGVFINKSKEEIDTDMEELFKLIEAAGGENIGSVIQNKISYDPSTYVGRGKAEEIYAYCEELYIDKVVFNSELSGSQIRNLEKIINRDVVDRTNLILDIFATRANTNEGKLQVKLAQLKYRLPRLSGSGEYLSRTGGGIGTRGPGEQKLETDRRHIMKEIERIEKRLAKVEKNREVLRNKRLNSNIPIIALVGYTNSGKSTLLNKLIKTADDEKSREVFVKDMLFATLETSLRRGEFKNKKEFLIIDTVGFVSNLPTDLVEAFKSTLEEIKYADLIVHVVDSSNAEIERQIEVTNKVLYDLKVGYKPTVYAFNKIDVQNSAFQNFSKFEPRVMISAKENINLDLLLDTIYENLPFEECETEMFFSYKEQDKLNYLLEKYKVEDIEYGENGTRVKLVISKEDMNIYRKNVIEKDV